MKSKSVIWKVCPYDSKYAISSNGDVMLRGYVKTYSNGDIEKKEDTIIEPKQLTRAGHKYNYISIRGKAYEVHRLVAELFLPNPEKCRFVCHKNSDTLKNNVDNLIWANVNQSLQKKFDAASRGDYAIGHRCICIETRDTYASIREASDKLNIPYHKLRLAVLSNRAINGYTISIDI